MHSLPVELRTPEHEEITMGHKHQRLKWRPQYFVNVDSRDCWNLTQKRRGGKRHSHQANVDTAVTLLFVNLSFRSHSTLQKINTRLLGFHWSIVSTVTLKSLQINKQKHENIKDLLESDDKYTNLMIEQIERTNKAFTHTFRHKIALTDILQRYLISFSHLTLISDNLSLLYLPLYQFLFSADDLSNYFAPSVPLANTSGSIHRSPGVVTEW